MSLKARMPWLRSLSEKIDDEEEMTSSSLRLHEKSISTDSWFAQIESALLDVSKEQS